MVFRRASRAECRDSASPTPLTRKTSHVSGGLRAAAAPDDLPLALAHVPTAPAHQPAQHPADDAPTLEP
eukprot:4614545-Prymnesium_polylepis.1